MAAAEKGTRNHSGKFFTMIATVSIHQHCVQRGDWLSSNIEESQTRREKKAEGGKRNNIPHHGGNYKSSQLFMARRVFTLPLHTKRKGCPRRNRNRSTCKLKSAGQCLDAKRVGEMEGGHGVGLVKGGGGRGRTDGGGRGGR